MKLEITIPDEMEPFAEELEFFISLMARKLHVNRHKGFATVPLQNSFRMLTDEVNELRVAMLDESQFNVMLEASDVANFAFLIHLRAATLDKEAYRRDQTTLASGTSPVQWTPTSTGPLGPSEAGKVHYAPKER